jgi:F-type H+-transporting ATPase subunit c
MKKLFIRLSAALSGLFISSLAFAEGATSSGGDMSLVPIGAGLAIGIATFGAATSQGRTASTALESIGRNPSAKDAMNQPLILGLVFMEFQALLGFVIAIMWTLK